MAAAQVGVRLIPVASGPHGTDPEDLRRAFAQTRARAFSAQPNYANPSGAEWPPELSWRTHRRSLRSLLEARRDLLVASLREHAPAAHLESVPRGGLNLWLRLPDGTDLARLTRECEAEGVIVAPGVDWFPAEPTGRYLRLNYSGPRPGEFPEAARVLGRVLG